MGSTADGFNFLTFLGRRQSPPTSSRTMPAEDDGALNGGQTTRRSLPKNLHGNYEGDLSMFTTRTTHSSGSLVEQILEAGLDLRLEQHFEPRTVEEHLDELEVDDPLACDEELGDKLTTEMLDQQLKAATMSAMSLNASSTPLSSQSASPASSFAAGTMELQRPSFWQHYKMKFFSAKQCKQIDLAIDGIRCNPLVRKMGNGAKIAALVFSSILRLLLLNMMMLAVNWNSVRCRNLLHKCSRRLLWCMTLAKCGDVQLFGLIILLSPLVFIVAALGLIFALYCVVKQGIQNFIRQIRYIEIAVPQIED